jgi:hypothetical protein
MLGDLVDGATYAFAVTAYAFAVTAVTVQQGDRDLRLAPPHQSAPDTMLPGPAVLLAWTDGGVSVASGGYVGTSVGANDLFDSGAGSERSMAVGELPTDGEVFVAPGTCWIPGSSVTSNTRLPPRLEGRKRCHRQPGRDGLTWGISRCGDTQPPAVLTGPFHIHV